MMATEKKNRSTRWKEPENLYATHARQGPKLQKFDAAARSLIVGTKERPEWTDEELLGVRIASRLGQLFMSESADATRLDLLRRVLEEFERTSEQRRRYWACRAIAEWAQRLQAGADRAYVLAECMRELCFADEAFGALGVDELGRRLDMFSARPAGNKSGKKGAETILAEFIFAAVRPSTSPRRRKRAVAPLGFFVDDDDDPTDAVERIRKQIDADVRSFAKSGNGKHTVK